MLALAVQLVHAKQPPILLLSKSYIIILVWEVLGSLDRYWGYVEVTVKQCLLQLIILLSKFFLVRFHIVYFYLLWLQVKPLIC